MKKPIFYQAKLTKIKDILKHVYGDDVYDRTDMTLEERMGKDAKCPDCGDNKWWLLPKEGSAVREGGKAYCECMKCGYTTHL